MSDLDRVGRRHAENVRSSLADAEPPPLDSLTPSHGRRSPRAMWVVVWVVLGSAAVVTAVLLPIALLSDGIGPRDQTSVAPSSTHGAVDTTLPSPTVTVTPPTGERAAGYKWPEPDGPPPWTSVPLGLPGTTHVRVTYGPLGFLSINNVSRGAVVRISVDGSTWHETAILQGPGGEEQVAVADLLVTDREYLVVGETWTNTATGSENFQDILWRSFDGATWDALVLDRLAPGAKATTLAAASPGLVVAGAVYDPETGAASPRLWLERPEGGFVELTGSIPGFNKNAWISGAAAVGDGLLVWGTAGDNTGFVWRTLDLETWSADVIEDDAFGHIVGVAPLGEGWVAVGGSRAWVSDDAVNWMQSARPDDFATDAVSEGWAGFGRIHEQDGYAVTVATVGYRSGIAWCYADPNNCGGMVPTVLVTPNGRDWRRLPFPGEHPQPAHPVEAHGFLVNGRLAVVHTVGEEAMLSILESVDNAVPLNSGEAPNLPFEVVGPGDQIEPGVEYGYAVWTHCGLPAIGPLNGVYWVVAPDSPQPMEGLPGWGGYVLGFITLTNDSEIDYRVDDEVIARYVPDPDHEAEFCI